MYCASIVVRIGYKFSENNAGIIGCFQAYVIKELLGAKVAECNEISQPLIYDDYGSNKITSQKEE